MPVRFPDHFLSFSENMKMKLSPLYLLYKKEQKIHRKRFSVYDRSLIKESFCAWRFVQPMKQSINGHYALFCESSPKFLTFSKFKPRIQSCITHHSSLKYIRLLNIDIHVASLLLADPDFRVSKCVSSSPMGSANEKQNSRRNYNEWSGNMKHNIVIGRCAVQN